jgi:peroxiredoxin Q/BCP
MALKSLEIGSLAPDFCLSDVQGNSWRLSEHHGKQIILYFYPKDMTPGCTTQACDFRDNMKRLTSLEVLVIGISKDSFKSHQKFIDAHQLNFTLLSDEEATVCEEYGVWVEKSMYGKKYFGIERTTFLIDEKGILKKIWSKVKVDGHVDEVLTYLQKEAAI